MPPSECSPDHRVPASFSMPRRTVNPAAVDVQVDEHGRAGTRGDRGGQRRTPPPAAAAEDADARPVAFSGHAGSQPAAHERRRRNARPVHSARAVHGARILNGCPKNAVPPRSSIWTRSIIAKSSTLAFGKPFFHGGLLNRRAVLRSAYAQFVFALAGADAGPDGPDARATWRPCAPDGTCSRSATSSTRRCARGDRSAGPHRGSRAHRVAPRSGTCGVRRVRLRLGSRRGRSPRCSVPTPPSRRRWSCGTASYTGEIEFYAYWAGEGRGHRPRRG